MPTFIAAALCRRWCVSPWHACVVASSDKELRALRRASCDRRRPMCAIPPPPPSGKSLEMHVCAIIRKRDPLYRRIWIARRRATSRDQLISAVGNSSRLKRRIYCDVFLRLASLKIDTCVPIFVRLTRICIERTWIFGKCKLGGNKMKLLNALPYIFVVFVVILRKVSWKKNIDVISLDLADAEQCSISINLQSPLLHFSARLSFLPPVADSDTDVMFFEMRHAHNG